MSCGNSGELQGTKQGLTGPLVDLCRKMDLHHCQWQGAAVDGPVHGKSQGPLPGPLAIVWTQKDALIRTNLRATPMSAPHTYPQLR